MVDAGGFDRSGGGERDALRAEELDFFVNGGAGGHAVESAGEETTADDAVAWGCRGEGVAAECLADGAG